MTDTKFTPGPYRVHPYSIKDGRNIRFEIVAKDAEGDESVVARTPDYGSPEGEATAHLLAAAPEMFQALRTMLEAFQVTTPKNEAEAMKNINARRIAREALSKAEGGAK